MRRQNLIRAVSLVPLFSGVSASLAAFPPPITDSPINNYTAQINVNYNQVQTFTEPLGLDPNTFARLPDLYWFKYVSDGKTQVTFDTLGSDFGTNGPGGGTGGGTVLGSYNQSQIAVYTAAGAPLAVSKNTVDVNGDPITIYPKFSSDSTQWYKPEGLSQLTFEPNAPTDPHWSVSPTDPTPYTGWSAPGNSGNAQRYYPPDYVTPLNEYQVWNTSLSHIILDNNGNPVINPGTGQPYSQPGWRYYDRARVGPGSTWNQYNALPAGVYYIAVSSVSPVFAGDTPSEQVLEAPISYDPSTGQTNQPELTSDLGTWQYYVSPNTQFYYGSIELNVTQKPIVSMLSWNNAGGTGNGATWDTATNQNWNDGTNPTTFAAGSDIAFTDANNGHYSVVLNTTVSPNSVYVNNSSGNYVISGTGSIAGTGGLLKNGTGTLTLSTANSYTGGTVVNGGTLVVGAAGALPANTAMELHNNGTVVRLASNTGPLTLSSLYLGDQTTLDIGNNHVVFNYVNGADPIASIRSMITSGLNGGTWNGLGITSTAAQTNSNYGVGYADSADPGNPAGLASGTIEIMYTLLGDANLDGKVNGTDFAILATNFNQAVTAWDQGDFNYDGKANGSDFASLASNFNQGATLADVAALDAFAAANGLLADVPEPGSLGVIGLALGALGFRKRQSRQI